MSQSRKYLLIGLIALNAIAAGLLAISRTDYRVDLSSVVEIWGDVVRDVDRFGRTITAVSIEKEIEIGNEIAKSFHPVTDENLQRYIDKVGRELTPYARRRGIPYKFQDIDWSVVNAFAVAGGHVLITKGMLENIDSEAELAGILAHEIAHIDLKHSIQQLQYELVLRRVVGNDLAAIVGIAQHLLTVSYSEQQEREADRAGMIMMAEAGYSPIEAIRAFVDIGSELEPLPDRLAKPERPELEIGRAIEDAVEDYFATHPVWSDRVRELDTILQRNMASWEGRTFYIGRSNYSDHIPRSEEHRDQETIVYSPDLPELRLVRGELLSRIGNYDQAIKHLSQVIASDPKMTKAYRLRAYAYAGLGEYEKSLSDLNAASDFSPLDLARLRSRYANLSDDAEQTERLEVLNELIALIGRQLSLKEYAAEILEKLATPEKSADANDEVEKLSVELVKLTTERGFLRLDQGHYEEALSDFIDALSFDPESKDAEDGKKLASLSLEIEKNPESAWANFDRGNAYAGAQYELGVMYTKGEGVPQDDTEAVKWYRKAAEQGHAKAQYNLGRKYRLGEGVPQDYGEAVKWYRMAAEQGDSDAQNSLGARYANGQGVPQDYTEAVKWYRKAAEQGDAVAQTNLGVKYRKGEGVPKDYAEAVNWYRKAAEQGYARAQFNLGGMYLRGRGGVAQDYAQVYMWSYLAAAQGHEKAQQRRDDAASKLTPDQIAEAKRMAREWMAAHQQ